MPLFFAFTEGPGEIGARNQGAAPETMDQFPDIARALCLSIEDDHFPVRRQANAALERLVKQDGPLSPVGCACGYFDNCACWKSW